MSPGHNSVFQLHLIPLAFSFDALDSVALFEFKQNLTLRVWISTDITYIYTDSQCYDRTITKFSYRTLSNKDALVCPTTFMISEFDFKPISLFRYNHNRGIK